MRPAPRKEDAPTKKHILVCFAALLCVSAVCACVLFPARPTNAAYLGKIEAEARGMEIPALIFDESEDIPSGDELGETNEDTPPAEAPDTPNENAPLPSDPTEEPAPDDVTENSTPEAESGGSE